MCTTLRFDPCLSQRIALLYGIDVHNIGAGVVEVTLQSVYQARRAIAGIAIRTPLLAAQSPGEGRTVRLKLETVQPIGAFKIRGAANALARLTPEARERGVVCASTGNHGRAVAYAARGLGVSATICMSRLVPENKLAAIRALGADIRIAGDSQDEAQVEASRLAGSGRVEIAPFDDPEIIAGQGT